jgi:hypothetical protein
MMKAAAVLLLLPLAVTAFSPLAGRTAKSSTIAQNVITSRMDWSMGEGDPEPEVRWFVMMHRIESLAFHAAPREI